jgi:hypothetical protein
MVTWDFGQATLLARSLRCHPRCRAGRGLILSFMVGITILWGLSTNVINMGFNQGFFFWIQLIGFWGFTWDYLGLNQHIC